MSSPAGPVTDRYDPARLSRARWGTAVVFVLLGVMQGTLASRMPALKTHADLSAGLLGLALLGIPAGSILIVQVTGRWIARRGSGPVTNTGALLMCVCIVGPAYATGFASFLGSLVVVGVGMGLTDTAMNAQAVTVEKAYRRPIMSSFHGFASLGALLGALVGAVAAHLDAAPQLQFPVVAASTLAVAVLSRSALLPGSADAHVDEVVEGRRPDRNSHRLPWSRTLVLLAGIALLSWMTEHAIADWSAVYLREHLDASGSVATYGFALFSTAMVVTRFLADRVTARLGPRRVLRWGGLVAGLGLGVGLLTDTVVGATIGCGLVGVGMAGVVPIVLTAAGSLSGSSAGSAVSKVVGVAYAGSLIGPPLIGLTADLTSLRTALFMVALAALAIGVAGPLAVRPPRPARGV